MNIFIVGPMGSGKSTVGKIISSELFLNFFDTDEEIESRTGASIDWIFDLEGEERKSNSRRNGSTKFYCVIYWWWDYSL
jgi:shikimate kinase